MGYHNVVFPENLTVGTRLGPGYRTLIVETDNATEYRTARFSEPLYRYDVAKAIQTSTDLAELLTFYHARQGAAYAFKFWDVYDHSTESDHLTAPTAGSTLTAIGTGDASETQFQLLKVYDDGSFTRTVNITKPKSGTVIVKVSGVTQTEGSDYTVDYDTGVITFDAGSTPGSSAPVIAGCQYYRTVRFASSADDWFAIEGEQNFGSLRSVPLVGIRDLLEGAESRWFGGADRGALTGDVTIGRNGGMVRSFAPDAGGHKVNLPDPSGMERGGPHFLIHNESGTYTLDVYDPVAASTICTVGTSSAAELWVRKNGSSNNEWVAI